MTRRGGPSAWLVRYLPARLLAAPEQLFLNTACFLIGVEALGTVHPGTVLAIWPRWAVVEWALAMMVGGATAAIGAWTVRRLLARFGFVLLLFACLLYGAAALLLRGWSALPVALMFLGISAAKCIRLAVTSAHRAEVIDAGRYLP